MEPSPFVMSADAAGEVVHAHVAYVLRTAGLRALHIKGPTVARWLYSPGERPWGDVDILVPPDDAHRALDVLRAAGAGELFVGIGPETSEDHAVTLLHHPRPDQTRIEIDVHSRFDGLEADPRRSFEELWRRREPETMAHAPVWFPDLTSTALLIAVNTARTSYSRKAAEDLARLIAVSDRDDWLAVIALARRVGAMNALRAGLELDPAGIKVVQVTPLKDVSVSPEWTLRAAGASRTAVRLAQLDAMSLSQKLVAVVRWTFPAPAVIRMRDNRAHRGFVPLLRGYANRYRQAACTLAPALVAHRRARHPTSGDRAQEGGVGL